MSKKKTCYECAYRGECPGSAHIRCKFDWSKSKLNQPEGNPHGIRNGWWKFPLNYDPVWMQGQCKAYSKKANPKMVKEKYDPLIELFSMLR